MRLTRYAQLLVAAAVLVAVTVPALDARPQDGRRWSITPYLWASGISETLVVDGAVVGGHDTEFKDLMDTIDGSLQLRFEGSA